LSFRRAARLTAADHEPYASAGLGEVFVFVFFRARGYRRLRVRTASGNVPATAWVAAGGNRFARRVAILVVEPNLRGPCRPNAGRRQTHAWRYVSVKARTRFAVRRVDRWCRVLRALLLACRSRARSAWPARCAPRVAARARADRRPCAAAGGGTRVDSPRWVGSGGLELGGSRRLLAAGLFLVVTPLVLRSADARCAFADRTRDAKAFCSTVPAGCG